MGLKESKNDTFKASDEIRYEKKMKLNSNKVDHKGKIRSIVMVFGSIDVKLKGDSDCHSRNFKNNLMGYAKSISDAK